jgi:O-antigen/teichoic acid export membrane protein
LFSKIRDLSRNVTVYGLGDVAVSIVNFFLLGVYVKYLDPTDYGVIAMLGSLEVIAKILFRFGLDGAFMRLFYEHERTEDRQRLASTIFFFLLILNGTIVAVLMAAAPAIADSVLGRVDQTAALRLMLLNTFAIGFTFIPFHVLRIEQRTVTFSLLTLARAVFTTIVRLVLVVQLDMGVAGLYLGDVIVTAGVMAALARWFAPLIRPMFSRDLLREALRFGVPRLPHAAAQQVIAVGDRLVLKALNVTMDNIGVYSMAVSFGLVQKLFLSAFESAWAPFYYATVREPDAPRIFRVITTYGVAVLALLTAGLSSVGRHAAQAMTHGYLLAPDDPRWGEVETVITWTAIGVFLQGIYLLTSIGLNITKRTEFYPLATVTAAAVNIALNFLLIPRFGIVGAAWANGAGYGVQAALGYYFSQRFYSIAYEWGRLIRVCGAAIIATLVARALPSIDVGVSTRSLWAPVPDLIARGVTVIAVFVGLLAVTRFFHKDELRRIGAMRRRRTERSPMASPDSTEHGGEIVATDIGDTGIT